LPTYELHALNLPKLTGYGLTAFTAAVENPLSRSLLLPGLLENGGIPRLRKMTLDEPPTYYPIVPPDSSLPAGQAVFEPGSRAADFPYRTASDYAAAFRQGRLSPQEAAERVLAAIEASEDGDTPLRAFIAVRREEVLAQAQAAGERIAAGRASGLLDGVPVAIKDEIDCLPYPTTVGTRFMGAAPAVQDSTVVARLRAAGAVIVGKTNMHEIGINPNGFNLHYGAVRNPYDSQRDPGGSSSGSAAAVSAGLVPLAIGADGGGSIRIPAALCGVVGLMSTFGRVSEHGAAQLAWSVGHLGPLAASVEDAALAYSLIAGPDPLEPTTLAQPPVTLAGWNRPDLKGVRLGIFRDWFEHAAPDVVHTCQAMVKQLESAGAEVRQVSVPWLDETRVAHAVTILSEVAAGMKKYRAQRPLHGPAVRLSLVLGDSMSAQDYLQAQRLRTRAIAAFDEVFRQVDAIITPATALPPQPIPAGGLAKGWSDLSTDTEMMRFIFPPNLTGHPAITFPAGYTASGLPVGMQAIGRRWEEHLLLRVAYNAEQAMSRRTPGRFYRVF
jgi:Asp-tRNA(Asn)/Glu-tRNA(Gln) amidotransferase A subunit family amidase